MIVDNGMDIDQWAYPELVIMVNDFKTAYDNGTLTSAQSHDDYQDSYGGYDNGADTY